MHLTESSLGDSGEEGSVVSVENDWQCLNRPLSRQSGYLGPVFAIMAFMETSNFLLKRLDIYIFSVPPNIVWEILVRSHITCLLLKKKLSTRTTLPEVDIFPVLVSLIFREEAHSLWGLKEVFCSCWAEQIAPKHQWFTQWELLFHTGYGVGNSGAVLYTVTPHTGSWGFQKPSHPRAHLQHMHIIWHPSDGEMASVSPLLRAWPACFYFN